MAGLLYDGMYQNIAVSLCRLAILIPNNDSFRDFTHPVYTHKFYFGH